MTGFHSSELRCDMCSRVLAWNANVSVTGMRQAARTKGWRKDKLGRDICPAHPKLKGARR